MGALAGVPADPFIIGLYIGRQEPGCVDQFLKQYCEEVEYLNTCGGVQISDTGDVSLLVFVYIRQTLQLGHI